MKPNYRTREKRGPPEERETVKKTQAGVRRPVYSDNSSTVPGRGVPSTAPPGPNPALDQPLSKRWLLQKSSYFLARKKIQLPVLPFWKGSPYPRPLVKYTSALPLRRGRPRPKVPLTRHGVPPTLGSGPIGTSQNPASAPNRSAGTSRTLHHRPPPQTQTRAPPNSPQQSRAQKEGVRGQPDGAGMDTPKSSKAVRSLQLCSPKSGSDTSSPSPSPSTAPLQRRRPRYLSRRYLQQMEWYCALRKEKKLRDAHKRLAELCSEVMVRFDGGSLKKGLSAGLRQNEGVNRVLIPGPAGRPTNLHSAAGSSGSKDPFTKKRKRSPQSSRNARPPRSSLQKRPLRRSWKLDSSSSSSSASPGSGTGGALTPAQTPGPRPVCSPTASGCTPLAPADGHFKPGPIPCALAEAKSSPTDAGPTPCSSTEAHTVPDALTSPTRNSSHTSAAAASSGALLAEDSPPTSPVAPTSLASPTPSAPPISSAPAPPTSPAPPSSSPPPTCWAPIDVAPPTDMAPPTCLSPPTGLAPPTPLAPLIRSAPVCEDPHTRSRLPADPSSLKSPTPPAQSKPISGRVSESKKAKESLVNTDTICNGAAAAPKTCNPSSGRSKMAPAPPAERRREPNPGRSDKTKAASDIKHLSSVKNDRAHLHSITVKPKSQSHFSARGKCPPSSSAAANRPPPGLKTSVGFQSRDSQSGFLNKTHKTEIVSGPSKQHSRLVNKKAAFALPCKLSKVKRDPTIQAKKTAKKSSACKMTVDAKPANQKYVRALTKKASLPAIGPGGAYFLSDPAVARPPPVIKGHRYRKTNPKMPSPSVSCNVCPVCQCFPLLESVAAGRSKVARVVSTGGRKKSGTAGRTPKPKLRDWSVVAPPLFSVLPADSTPTSRPKPATRRGSETGRRSAEDSKGGPKWHAAAPGYPHTARTPGPSRHTAFHPRSSTPAAGRPRASVDPRPGRRGRDAVSTAERLSLTSATASPELARVISERWRGLDSPCSAFPSPNTPVPGDNSWLSSISRSNTPSVTRRDAATTKNTKKPQSPKATPRKTLFAHSYHRGGAQKAGRDGTGIDQSRAKDNATAAPKGDSQEGAPHPSRNRTKDSVVGEGNLLSGRDGSSSPPAPPRPPSPELIETLVSVMTSLLGLQPPQPGSLLWDTCRNTPPKQEESCPARNLGFLLSVKAKRERLEELKKRVERLTAELQEAKDQLESEMTECHRPERETRDRGEEREEGRGERETERGRATGQENFE